MAVDTKRSTKRAPVALSISYLMGSAFIGISMITLKSLPRSRPDVTRSRFMLTPSYGRFIPGSEHHYPSSRFNWQKRPLENSEPQPAPDPHARPAWRPAPLGHLATGGLVLRQGKGRLGDRKRGLHRHRGPLPPHRRDLQHHRQLDHRDPRQGARHQGVQLGPAPQQPRALQPRPVRVRLLQREFLALPPHLRPYPAHVPRRARYLDE